MIQMERNLYLELLDDTSPFLKKMEFHEVIKEFSQPFGKVEPNKPFGKVEPNILVHFLLYFF